MIAVIPITLTDVRVPIPQPLRDPWSAEDFHHWLDPNRKFSLAHYWDTASWGTLDLRYRLWDPVRMKDPRKRLPADATMKQIRETLVAEVIAGAHRQVGFVGDGLSGVLLFFMNPCDLFGGSSVSVPLSDGSSAVIAAMVCEIYNAFDLHAHEFGHMMGLEHPWDASQNDYGSPYDIMSAAKYGEGAWSMYPRDEVEGLPDGIRFPDHSGDPRDTHVPPQWVVGPLLSGAQVTRLPSFLRFGIGKGAAGVVVDLGDRPQRQSVTERIYALEHARAQYPGQRLTAVVRTTGLDGYQYMLEVRRGGSRAVYDHGIGLRPASPPEAVVLHHYNDDLGRFMYDGAVPLSTAGRDPASRLKSESAGVSIHIAAVAPDGVHADVVIERHVPGIKQTVKQGLGQGRLPDVPDKVRGPIPKPGG